MGEHKEELGFRNAMKKELESITGTSAIVEAEGACDPPVVSDVAKMHGVLKGEIPEKGAFFVALVNHIYSLRYTTGKKNKKEKKTHTILCDQLIFDEDGDHDIANGTVVDKLTVKNGVVHIEALTRAARRRIKEERSVEQYRISVRNNMIKTVETMISNADKGPSGFWADDYEGCGNPKIFPEFERGLEHGDYIYKEYTCCPWDTAILYGSKEGICGGCYHHCGIYDAKYLTTEMIRDVLSRFLENLQSDMYEKSKPISPLLTQEEKEYVELAKEKEKEENECKYEQERADRLARVAPLIEKYPEDQELARVLADYYGTKAYVLAGCGVMVFDEAEIAKIVGAGKMSYDEFLELQWKSMSTWRGGFEKVYFCDGWASYNGKIQNKTKDKVCFNRIYIKGFYCDGNGFEGREEHVWMDAAGFEKYHVGDCLSFSADIYRYVKTKHGKLLDFGLCNPSNIEQIEEYHIPSDDDLLKQWIDKMICDHLCMYHDHCYKDMCIANDAWRNETRQIMYSMSGNFKLFEEKQLPSDENLLKQEIDRTICNDMCTYHDQCDNNKCNDKIICVNSEWRDVTRQVLYNIAKRKEVKEDYE